MDVKAALAQVDALDDDNFTADGNVKVDVVSKIAGRSVTRQEIIDAAPAFNKANPVVETTAEAEGAKAPVAETVAADEPEAETPEVELEDIDVSMLREFQNADPMNERDFVSFLGDVPSNNLHGLEEMLIEQQSEVESQISTLEEMRDNVRRSLSYTRSRIKVEIPDVDNQSAIRAFIASQTAQRSAKAETAAKVRSMINVHDLDPRSTIDRAMARRTERGGKRPVKI
jgi:hypothetical protein